MMEVEKPIEVYNVKGQYLSNCHKKRAAQMIKRGKAKWTGHNRLVLLMTDYDAKQVRKRVKRRDNMTCIYCDETLTDDTLTFDHLTPRSRGGSDEEENLACSCEPCNADKADLTYEEYFMVLMYRIIRLAMRR